MISLMADDALPWNGNWPPPVGYWSLTLPDGRAVVEALVGEHGGEMHFTCTECGMREDFYCDLCASHSSCDTPTQTIDATTKFLRANVTFPTRTREASKALILSLRPLRSTYTSSSSAPFTMT
jgi:hypothetical protein